MRVEFTVSAPPGDRGRLVFRRERDVGAVISATFEFLRETWRELGLGLLYIAGPVLLLTGIASFFVQTRLLGMMGELERVEQQNPGDPMAVFDAFGGMFGPSYVLVLMGGLVAGLLVTAVVYGYVRLYRQGQAGRIPPGVLWGEASHLVGRSALVWLLIGVVTTLCALLIFALCLGLVAFVAVLPALSLVPALALLRGRGVMEAFAEGWRLARGAWLPTFGVVVIAGLIWYAFVVALSLPSSIAGFVIGWNSSGGEALAVDSGGMRALMAAGTVLGAFGYLFYAVPLVATALQYYSLVEQEEGGGLGARVDLLASDEPSPPPPPPPPLPPRSSDAPSSEAPRAPGFRGSGFGDEGDA